MSQLCLAARVAAHPAGCRLRASASPSAAPCATASGWRHAIACRTRRPARPPLPARAAGKKDEHDLHNLTNVDASEMQSDPGDLGRVADGVMEEQPADKPRRRRSATSGSKTKGASATTSSARRGRRKKGDPHELLNVDADPLESDPGDVGRTAPGVLEQYEHLNKVHPASHSQPAPAASASAASEGGPAGGGASSGVGGAAEGQPGGAGTGPAADSDMLKTDSPGAAETQHPGETSPGVIEPKEEQYFESTGGVLLDVSHAAPHPYHGEGVGRREDTHAGAHEGKGEGPAGGGGLSSSSSESMESEGADVSELE